MQQFMLLYKGGDPDWMEKTSPEEMAASMEKWGAWMAELEQKGQLETGGSPLAYTGKSLTKEGVVTDIASTELKELVSGYSIVKAKDMHEAIAIARDCPIFNYPDITVDIREVISPTGEC